TKDQKVDRECQKCSRQRQRLWDVGSEKTSRSLPTAVSQEHHAEFQSVTFHQKQQRAVRSHSLKMVTSLKLTYRTVQSNCSSMTRYSNNAVVNCHRLNRKLKKVI